MSSAARSALDAPRTRRAGPKAPAPVAWGCRPSPRGTPTGRRRTPRPALHAAGSSVSAGRSDRPDGDRGRVPSACAPRR